MPVMDVLIFELFTRGLPKDDDALSLACPSDERIPFLVDALGGPNNDGKLRRGEF